MFGVAKNEYVWVLTRDIEVPRELYDKIKNIIRERLPWYDLDNLYNTKQGGKCKYLPVEALEDEEYRFVQEQPNFFN